LEVVREATKKSERIIEEITESIEMIEKTIKSSAET
jgi:hypothetical protein